MMFEIGAWILFLIKFLAVFGLGVLAKSIFDNPHDWFD